MNAVARVALVLGGGSGLGAATATALQHDGCDVVTADLANADVEVDITDEDAVADLFRDVVESREGLQVVVNSAGTSTLASIADHDAAEFRRVVDVNLVGAFLVIKHAARQLTSGGCLTSITSLNARQPGGGLAAYCAAKAGPGMLTQVAALALGARGIRVNAVAPGLGITPLTAPAMDIPGIKEDYVENTPLGRPGTPEEVADAVVWATHAEWLTGTTIDLDGGAHLQRYPDLLGHVQRAFGGPA